jgi:hypothetical protein
MVTFKLGLHKQHGRVVEDRGNIGFDGRRLLAVRFPESADPDDQMTIELPEDEIAKTVPANGRR